MGKPIPLIDSLVKIIMSAISLIIIILFTFMVTTEYVEKPMNSKHQGHQMFAPRFPDACMAVRLVTFIHAKPICMVSCFHVTSK